MMGKGRWQEQLCMLEGRARGPRQQHRVHSREADRDECGHLLSPFFPVYLVQGPWDTAHVQDGSSLLL